MSKTLHFKAYGLTIESDIDLMIAPVQESYNPDVKVKFGNISRGAEKVTWDGVQYSYRGNRQLTLTWDIIGTFLVESGREVLIDPIKSAISDDIRQPILGTILAMILQQRGCLVFHGSAVLVAGKVIIFTGCKGQGKSTLAAWLNKKGYPLLSDDICAIDHKSESDLTVRPAFPKIKLNPDSLKFMGEDPENLERVHPKHSKRVQDMVHGFCDIEMPLGAICTLETGDNYKLERLCGMDAIKEVLTHMLVNRFPENQPVELSKETFIYSTQLTNTIPVYRLTRPRNMEKISEIAKFVKNISQGKLLDKI